MVDVVKWGESLERFGVSSLTEAKHIRKVLTKAWPEKDIDVVFYEGNLIPPVRSDNAYKPLSEEETIEFLRGEAWPKLVEEGRIKMKNGRPVLIREGMEQSQTGGVTITQALRDAFGE